MLSSFKFRIAIAFFSGLWTINLAAQTAVLSGAGSSAAAPVYRAWASAFARTEDFKLNYDPAGSSAGVSKIKAGEVGFGASDVAPSEADLNKSNLVLVPTFVTGALPVVNVPRVGNGKLRLTADVLADIFQGKIKRWNDPEIQKLNTNIALPDLEILPVVRSDGSGTTYYFTDYLSKVSTEFKEKFGAKSVVAWPAGFIRAKGNDGVAKTVKETVGAIGYTEFNYVTTMNLNPVQLRNAAGEYVAGNAYSFRAALRVSDWSRAGNFHSSLTNLSGNQVWPITMGTFVILPKVGKAGGEAALALRFFVWALIKADQLTESMSFVRLPDKMQALAFKALSGIKDEQGKSLSLDALTVQTGH